MFRRKAEEGRGSIALNAYIIIRHTRTMARQTLAPQLSHCHSVNVTVDKPPSHRATEPPGQSYMILGSAYEMTSFEIHASSVCPQTTNITVQYAT
jgi:hypothetical protein